jgi:signal transduction histidine kinase
MLGESPPEPRSDLRPRLRIAALIALAVVVLFVPLEARFGTPGILGLLAPVWGIHAGLGLAALAASYAALAARVLDRIVLAIVLGYVANAHLHLYLVPAQTGLVGNGLVYLFVVCGVFFSWTSRRLLVVAALSCVGIALLGLAVVPEAGRGAFFTSGLGALTVGSGIAVVSARVLGELRASLARRQHELTALSARLMSAQEEERRRLARELHDEFGQSLTAVNAYLWLIERQGASDPDALRTQTSEARRVVARTLGAMRELSQLLRPSVLDDFGLVASLDSHLQAFAKRHGIATSLATEGLPDRLPAEVETALYRIAQEALTNVVRHARATQVRVALTASGGALRLEVRDDGVGFPAGNGRRRRGTGLIGIRERARALGGTVRVESGPGATLRVELPLPR